MVVVVPCFELNLKWQKHDLFFQAMEHEHDEQDFSEDEDFSDENINPNHAEASRH